MKKEKQKNNIIIGALLITISLMTIGYAYIASKPTSSNITKENINWNISFLSINKNPKLTTTNAIENKTPSSSGTAITFNVTLPNPNSKIVYDIVVQNTGTIDATYNKILGIDELNQINPTEIIYKLERLDSENGSVVTGYGELINTIGKNYFRLTIERPESATTIDKTPKIGTVYIDYTQKTK